MKKIWVSEKMTFEEIITSLHNYWKSQGCVILEPYDVEVGAGTFNPQTFLKVLGPSPWRVAYVQPSRRPSDGRYGKNPNRVYQHHQYQVILKPVPSGIQDIYLSSLKAIGIDIQTHDIKFDEDNWESPSLGAWGLGWQVLLDGIEITQFTYFQQSGGVNLKPVSVELAYGIERIAMFIQNVGSIFDIEWHENVTYGDIFLQNEEEFSKYSFEVADKESLLGLFEICEREAKSTLKKGLTLPAYDYTLKCSHVFNTLDSRGAISVSERAAFLGRVRALARECAFSYTKTLRKKEGKGSS